MKDKKKVSSASRIKNTLNDYFTFTKNERRGIRAMMAILIVLLGVLYYSNFIALPKPKLDIAVYQKEIAAFEASLTPFKKKVFTAKNSVDTVTVAAKEFPVALFAFNPNNLPEEQWKKLGVPDWIIKRIKNYEIKGGHFWKKEDLQKIYMMPPDLYERLRPYIEIDVAEIASPKKMDHNMFASTKKVVDEHLMVDINTADEKELTTLPMIGAGRAKAIIAQRNKLHGFASKEQLHEVWGMVDSVCSAIENHVEVRAKTIEQININTNDPSTLRHPYISFSLAKMIVTYHTTHGDYKDLGELKKLPLMNEELFIKLAPYLTLK